MDEGSEVYQKSDRKRRVIGFIVKDLGGKPGKRRFTVAWVGTGAKPTDHDEADLVAVHRRGNHTVSSNVTGNVVQADTIHGGVFFPKS